MKALKLLSLIIAGLLVIVPLAACTPGQATTKPAPAKPAAGGIDIRPVAFQPADSLKPEIYKALSGFSLDLFRRMAEKDAGKNVFVSPLSVWLALSMTYNGASGSTAVGMGEALHASGVSIEDLNRDNEGLMGLLMAADPKVQIAIANSIWMRKGLEQEFSEDFLARDRQHYAAQIGVLDFNDAGAAGVINKWVEDNTNGNIKSLVEPPIDPMTVMFLVNAVHFKAPWKQAFDAKKTLDGPFTRADGTGVQVKFLNREEDNLGFTDESLIAARIPYASGRLEMVAIAPLAKTLPDYIASLTPEKLDETIAKCGKTSLALKFPKFKLEYKAELNDQLKAMGMEEAFGNGADFTNMSEKMGKELLISKVSHKSFIEVNEEGTEASAATSVEMRTTGMLTSLEFSRPFVYLIRDGKTGAILFMGTMEDPS